MMTKLFYASMLLATMTAAPVAAQVRYLDFENIAPYPNVNNVEIGSFYNGGTSSVGTSGPNLGVEFTSAATLLCLNTAGVICSNTSRGGAGIPTSQFGALFFPNSNPIMNVAAGFDTGFAGVFSNPFSSATTISIYDGLDASGLLLATISLPGTANGGTACASFGAAYCPFESFSLAFDGVGRSVLFGGSVNAQVFDDLTFGSTVAGGVPEPATWAMMLIGFGAIGYTMRRRRVAIDWVHAG